MKIFLSRFFSTKMFHNFFPTKMFFIIFFLHKFVYHNFSSTFIDCVSTLADCFDVNRRRMSSDLYDRPTRLHGIHGQRDGDTQVAGRGRSSSLGRHRPQGQGALPLHHWSHQGWVAAAGRGVTGVTGGDGGCGDKEHFLYITGCIKGEWLSRDAGQLGWPGGMGGVGTRTTSSTSLAASRVSGCWVHATWRRVGMADRGGGWPPGRCGGCGWPIESRCL